MTEIIRTNNFSYLNEIKSLYIATFNTGDSKQYIDQKELDKRLTDILNQGYALLAYVEENLAGALLCIPLSFDKDLPIAISKTYNVDKSIYIAELMVAEKFRGQQIGKNLLAYFQNTIDSTKFNHIFIRVWKKNTIALNLYTNAGFAEVAEIIQTKQTPDKTETYNMLKVYLQKNTTHAAINFKNH